MSPSSSRYFPIQPAKHFRSTCSCSARPPPLRVLNIPPVISIRILDTDQPSLLRIVVRPGDPSLFFSSPAAAAVVVVGASPMLALLFILRWGAVIVAWVKSFGEINIQYDYGYYVFVDQGGAEVSLAVGAPRTPFHIYARRRTGCWSHLGLCVWPNGP